MPMGQEDYFLCPLCRLALLSLYGDKDLKSSAVMNSYSFRRETH